MEFLLFYHKTINNTTGPLALTLCLAMCQMKSCQSYT